MPSYELQLMFSERIVVAVLRLPAVASLTKSEVLKLNYVELHATRTDMCADRRVAELTLARGSHHNHNDSLRIRSVVMFLFDLLTVFKLIENLLVVLKPEVVFTILKQCSVQ
jgi:hypothetical protein